MRSKGNWSVVYYENWKNTKGFYQTEVHLVDYATGKNKRIVLEVKFNYDQLVDYCVTMGWECRF